MIGISYTSSFILILSLSLISEDIERAVQVAIEVNEEFTSDHGDPSSNIYNEFVDNFILKVDPLYRHISNFVSVENISLSAGGPLVTQNRHRGKRSLPLNENPRSLKVKHDAIFTIKNDENANDDYNYVLKEVNETLQDLKNISDLSVNTAAASPTELNAKELCAEATKNLTEDFQKYYVGVMSGGKVTCVTSCNNNHPQPKTCMNSGTCAVAKQGPTCYCHQTDAKWFLGEDCSFQVYKVGLYAGLGIVAAIAVITIAILTVYLVINKRTVKRNKDIKQELVKEWLDDDFEWPPQNKTSYSDGTYDNPVYSRKQDSFGKPDFSADRFYTQNFSPDPDIHLRYLQRDQPMKMDRPQIRSSFDI
ncbi:mucin-3A [Rhinichthys klamathensis goyatoka]|uniref:mucin-3A n=1 Tax=Rhinichthys klamathensis goyatoka TaxID=3034132 RepID=UPI0024B60384|nr:mucin-3A [Rhinichthys klamathensis goyatoka]